MRTHHLDANGIELGILQMIRPHPGGFQNLDLGGAVCRAINDWQVAEWTGPEPRLKASIVVPYEDADAAWLPPLAWRLDRAWERLRAETPAVDRPPSEIIRDHFWLTTQPMEGPDDTGHLADTIGWIGWDRLLFATDYSHWDYDDPRQALKLPVTGVQRDAFFGGNARALFLGA